MATAVLNGEPASRRWRVRLPERLPNLNGKWLTAYTVVWAIMLATALPVASRATYLFMTAPAIWSPYGFNATEDVQGVRVDSVMSRAARESGLRAGDYVVAIDGWGVPHSGSLDAVSAHLVKADGAQTRFTARRGTHDIFTVRLIRSRANVDQAFRDAGVSRAFFVAMRLTDMLLLPLLFVAAALLLFIRRRHEAVPAILSLAFLVFATIINGADVTIGVEMANAITSAGFILLFAALFAFPSGRFEPRWTAVPALLLLPTTLLFLGQPLAEQLLAVGYTLLCLTALVSRYRRVGVGLERLQLRWAFFGLAAGMILTALASIGFSASLAWRAQDPRWVIWQYTFVTPLGSWALGLMALGLIVSILRYRLYDADAVIGRSAAYGLLTLGFVALFAGTEKLAEILGERYFAHSIGIAAGAVGAAVAAAVIVPLHNRVHRWAERRFQKPLIRLREGLPECVSDLRESAPVEQLVSAVMSRVEAGVRSTREAVLLVDRDRLALAGIRNAASGVVEEWQGSWNPSAGGEALDCDRHDALFPLRVRLCIESSGEVPETIGWLLLGPRPDGSFFGRDEREALVHVAGPVARAIHIAQLRQQRDEQAEKRLSALEILVAKLLDGIPTAASGGAAQA